ncbi:helix-turn-helix transcriptional regulator [Methylocella sp.]
MYRKMADGTFPRPVSAGTKLARWRASEIQAWIEALSMARPA